MVSQAQRGKLITLLTAFLDETLIWEPPLSGEREPGYTARVVRPQVQDFLQTLMHHGLTLRADGGDRPFPVVINEQHFYPDLAINDYSQREIAIEVKILATSSFSDPLSKAIGQAVAYRSGGYPYAIALIVSKSGESVLTDQAKNNLNQVLETMGVTLVVVER